VAELATVLTRDFCYYLDTIRNVLWIIPPKCASTSIRKAIESCSSISRSEAMEYNELFTVAFIRHPYDRATSALYSVLRTFGPLAEKLRNHIEDPHVCPQSHMFDGFRIDFLGRFDRLKEDWGRLQQEMDLPDLTLLHKGKYRPKDWHSVLDWSLFEKDYRQDMELWQSLRQS